MTNTEKNIRIAELLGYDIEIDTDNCVSSEVLISNAANKLFKSVNYCEDFNQLMPLCIEHGISFINIPNDYYCFVSTVADSENENPQTALVDCLIAVLEAKEESAE